MKRFVTSWRKPLAIAAALLLLGGGVLTALRSGKVPALSTAVLTAFAATDSEPADSEPEVVVVEEQVLRADEVAPRSVLNADEHFPDALLAAIRDGLMAGEKNVDIDSYGVLCSRESELWLAVKQKYPLDTVAAAVKERGYWHYVEDGKDVLQKLTFTYAPSVEGTSFDERRAALEPIVNPAVNSAKNLSAYSKIMYIHDLLSVNGTYDDSLTRFSAYELLCGGTAVCQGYAEAFQMYMDLLNVPCVIVTSKNHAWNMVKLDGNWYHIDVTWDDGLDKNTGFPALYIQKSRRYDFALLTDAQIQTYQDHTDWLPHYNANAQTYASMPRGYFSRQVWVKDRWYYYDDTAKALCSCNAYGGDKKTLYTPANGFGGPTLDMMVDAWDGVVVFLSGKDVMAYWTDTGHVGKLHTLTSAEKAKSDIPDDCEMDSLAVNAQGQLSYRYMIWKLKSSSGGTYQYESAYTNGASTVDLRTLAANLRSVYAKLDALPATLTDSSRPAAQEALNAYDLLLASLTDTEKTNLDASHKAKAEKVRTFVRTIPATGLTLSQSTLVLRTGKTGTLTASVTPSNSSDAVVWTSSDTNVATVSGGAVTAGKNTGSAVITAKAGSRTATCKVEVVKIYGASSKLYEPWGMRFYAYLGSKANTDIAERGIAVHKLTGGVKEMAYEDFLADPQTQVFRASASDGTLTYDTKSGGYYATFTKGIYSYDIASSYLTLGFIRLKNGDVIYTNRPSFSMEAILNTNLAGSSVSSKEKAICTCILALKNSVAKHYAAVGVPSVSLEQSIARGSSQTAASAVQAGGSSAPQITGVASRLIEPWGLRFYATFPEADANVKDIGMVMLCKTYYSDTFKTTPDKMRLHANAYVFRKSQGTLTAQGSGRYYCTLAEGISSKDIADKYYTLAFAEMQDGTYVYSSMASKSMKKVMETNDGLSTVPATEKAVGKDIIALYNAVQAYYN